MHLLLDVPASSAMIYFAIPTLLKDTTEPSPGIFFDILVLMIYIKSMITHIDHLSAPELQIFSSYNENQLRRYYEPEAGIFIAESPNVIARALAAGYEPISALICENELTNCNINFPADLPVYAAPFDVLTQITGFELTRGLLCAMRRRALPSPEMILAEAKNIAVLDDIENPTNVGAIFRSAAALNVDAILLTQGSSDPLYRRAIRVSMGNVFNIPWTFFDKDADYISLLKESGYTTIAMALKENAKLLDDPVLKSSDKTAVILGNEGMGLPQKTIDACDYTCIIPMKDNIDSLNVAAASAVTFWELFHKKK